MTITLEQREEIIKARIKYYNDEYNLYQMSKYCKDRELAILDYETPFFLRANYAQNEFMLSRFLKTFNVATNIYRNIYISSATYSGFPNFKYKPKDVSRTDYFFDYVKTKISSYDLLIDFDCKDLTQQNTVKMQFINFSIGIKKQHKILCLNSGKGFHCVIKDLDLNLNKFDNEILIEYEELGFKLKANNNLTFYDTKNLGVWNRLQKMPLSLVLDKPCNIIEV